MLAAGICRALGLIPKTAKASWPRGQPPFRVTRFLNATTLTALGKACNGSPMNVDLASGPVAIVAVVAILLLALMVVAAIGAKAKASSARAGTKALPYRLRPFLSAAELRFFQVLQLAVNDSARICPKVRLADIFDVAGPTEGRVGHRNRISQKHVDFLLCDPATMVPTCAVELDDSSHRRRKRRERDHFVDEVFRQCGLRLVHIRAAAEYDAAKLREQIPLANDP